MSDEQFEFLQAIDDYKKQNVRPFPTWTEVLEVIRHLDTARLLNRKSLEITKR